MTGPIDLTPSTTDQTSILTVFARALGLTDDAGESAVVAAIEALRLLKHAETLDHVRAGLSLTAKASALDCAAELCRRLPADAAFTAIVAMQLVETKDRLRRARVDLIRSACGAA